jgi:LysM repeat protein
MSDKFVPPQDFIDNYKKRQKLIPVLFGALAILLVVVGILVIIIAGKSQGGWFATKIPTATVTFTPTATVPSPTPTATATETQTPLPTMTSTPNGPFEYIVQTGDNCYDIATKFNVDLITLLAINNFTSGGCPIQPNQTIMIPAPGQKVPTPTSIPSDLPRGTKIQYTVQAGDTLYIIASKFNTTVESIVSLNKTILTDVNKLNAGDILTISVNLVTPTPTHAPTSTKAATTQAPPTATPTK